MTLRTRLLVNAAVTMICFAAVIGFTIVNMMKIQASNEDEVDALLNVQEAKADLNTLKKASPTIPIRSQTPRKKMCEAI